MNHIDDNDIKVGDSVVCTCSGIIGRVSYGRVVYIKACEAVIDSEKDGLYITKTIGIKKITPKAPIKDTPIDTKIIVWDNGGDKHKRYLSHVTEDGRIYAFPDGCTAWSARESGDDPVCWQHAEIYED